MTFLLALWLWMVAPGLSGTAPKVHPDYVGAFVDVRTLKENATRLGLAVEECPTPGKDALKQRQGLGPGLESSAYLMAHNVSAMRTRGLFNTGTNYLSSILFHLGFPLATSDGGGFVDASGAKRWKHAPFSSESYTSLVAANWNEVNLVIVRHPVPWALSTMSRSYDLSCDCSDAFKARLPETQRRGCRATGVKDADGAVKKTMPWDSVVNGSCDWPVKQKPGVRPQIMMRPQPHSRGGLGDVWSVYYASYLSAPNAIFLRYEDLIREPVELAKRLFVRPISFARRVIIPANASSVPASPSATTMHASLPDCTMMPRSKSETDILSPTLTNILEPPFFQAFSLTRKVSSSASDPFLRRSNTI